MEPQLQKLLNELASSDANTAEDAQHQLTYTYGANALSNVLNILGTLNTFSRRCAIDYILDCDVEEVRKESAKVLEVLLPMLNNEDEVTRQRTAQTFGWLGLKEAVPAIQEALENAKTAGIPVEWSEPTEYRWALSRLGARKVVLPERARQLLSSQYPWEYSWEIRSCVQVVQDLALAGQVICYLQTWECKYEKNKMEWYLRGGDGYQLDWTRSWDELVKDTQTLALEYLKNNWHEPYVVTIQWIDKEDL